MDMRILSIDHSFKRTGYSIVDENKKLLCTGSIELGNMTYKNILKFRERIIELLEIHKPDVVVTEKPAHMRNGNIARMLSGLHTEIILEVIKDRLDYGIVNPKTVKKHITGSGSATKEDVMRAIIEKYGYEEDLLCYEEMTKRSPIKVKEVHYDESDSVANALTYLDLGGES